MGFSTIVSAEASRCFWENKQTKEKGVMFHAKAFIAILWRGKHEITFKLTKKGNHYDSRDKGSKPVTAQFVKDELRRMLGFEEGTRVYMQAQQEMAMARFTRE